MLANYSVALLNNKTITGENVNFTGHQRTKKNLRKRKEEYIMSGPVTIQRIRTQKEQRQKKAIERAGEYLVYRSCTRKHRYKTANEAEKAAKRLSRRFDKGYRAYECEACNGWHLTSKKDVDEHEILTHNKGDNDMQINSIQGQQFGALKWTGDNIFQIAEKAGLSEAKSKMIKSVCDHLPFPRGTEIWIMKPQTTIGKAPRKRGAIIAITGSDICKGVIIDPITCNDKMLAYKYALAMKRLSKTDMSARNNVKEQLSWIG